MLKITLVLEKSLDNLFAIEISFISFGLRIIFHFNYSKLTKKIYQKNAIYIFNFGSIFRNTFCHCNTFFHLTGVVFLNTVHLIH